MLSSSPQKHTRASKQEYDDDFEFTCPESEMKCPKSNQCIQESWRCDGDSDCEHDEDELNCDLYTCTNTEVK